MRKKYLYLLLLLLLFSGIFYSLQKVKNTPTPSTKIIPSDLCSVQEVNLGTVININDACISFYEPNQYYNASKTSQIDLFEDVEDRHIGYKLIKPIGFEEYGYNSNGDVVDSYQLSVSMHHNLGVASSDLYKIVKFFKDPEADFAATVKSIVGDTNVLYKTAEDNELIKDFQNLFPPQYEILHVSLQSHDTHRYGAPDRALVAKSPSRFFIYNKDYPYMFFLFDTGTIGINGADDYQHYLPNGLVWQSSFRIIEGNRPYEVLYKSHGVPRNTHPGVIHPLKYTFNVRGDQYYFYTPGNQDEGYNFDLVLMDVNSNEETRDEIVPVFWEETIDEVRKHIKPIVIEKPKENENRGGFLMSSNTPPLQDGDFQYLALDTPPKSTQFDTKALLTWFSLNLLNWIIVDKPVINDSTIEYQVNVFKYELDSFRGLPSSLSSEIKFVIILPNTLESVDSRPVSQWRLDLVDLQGSDANVSVEQYAPRYRDTYGDEKTICTVNIPILSKTIEGNVVVNENCEIVN